jgi:AraC family transcriptional regulator
MKKSTQEIYKQRILRVLVYIQRNLDREMSLEELSKEAHFSPYHFHRIFRAIVDEPLKEHIRRLRLERAASSLKHTDKPVIDIALEAGYQTHEAFTRAFKAALGCSPSDYRSNSGLVSQIDKRGVCYGSSARVEEFNLEAKGESVDVRIEHIESMRVAFVRHVGTYDEVGAAWDRLCVHLGKDGHLGSNSKFIGICYDDPEVTAPARIRYDACVTVGEDVTCEGDVGIQRVGGGEYAVTSHFGPYNKLGETYNGLFRWLLQNDRELRAEPCMESYMNDPESTDPEDLVTDICVPLKPKR